MAALTTNEKEFIEILHDAENPEEAVLVFADILKKMLDKDSVTYKITELMAGRYSFAEFAAAANMTELEAFNLVSGNTEPTLDQVILIAKAFDKEPEEIAQIFIDQQAK